MANLARLRHTVAYKVLKSSVSGPRFCARSVDPMQGQV